MNGFYTGLADKMRHFQPKNTRFVVEMSLNSQLDNQTLLLDVCCLPEMLDDESTRVK